MSPIIGPPAERAVRAPAAPGLPWVGGLPPSWENQSGLSVASPAPREGAAFAYDGAPGAGTDVLFGGETLSSFLNDTWTWDNGSWKNVTATACAIACPPELAFSSLTYDPVIRADVLLGGLTGCPGNGCPQGYETEVWLFEGGAWIAGPGTVPYDSASASAAWYAPLGCILMFGGLSPTGALGSTYCYNATTGTSSSFGGSPPARWGAAMANSSLGFDVLFGGSALLGPLNDTWIFANGSWRSATTGPSGAPPGAIYPALAESPAATVPGAPAAGDVVLFGGEGENGTLNDTWTFRASTPLPATGAVYGNWTPDASTPTPPPLYAASATLDFNASRVVLTDGISPGHPNGLPLTWAYFHLAAQLTLSSTELNAESPLTVTTLAGGGSAPYDYLYTGLPAGCTSADTTTITCSPSAHGRFTVSVTVTDAKGRTATSGQRLIVDPFGSRIYLRSEFSGMFYTGFSFNNTFGADTAIPGYSLAWVRGSLGGERITFTHSSGSTWNATVQMGGVAPGAELTVEANYTNWSLFDSRPVVMVVSPPWMESIYGFPGAILVPTTGGGSGGWNETDTETVTMGWSLGTLLNFALPTSGFSGAYALIPGITATFAFDSGGNVTISGSLTNNPDISVGPIDISAEIPGLNFHTTVSVTGTFTVVPLGPVGPSPAYTVAWGALTATLALEVEFETEVPLYPAASPEGGIGLELSIKLTPSVTVTVDLDPATAPGGFLGGLDVVISNLLVDLGVAFSVALQAGISDVFEVGGGGTLSLQTLFETATPHLAGVWLNASVDAFIQFLCFKVTWTLWSGTLYQYGGDPPALPRYEAPVAYTWELAPRYYNSSQYESLVWSASRTSGTAVADLYPAATPAIAASGSQALVAYASDDVSLPERAALGLGAVALASDGGLSSAPGPSTAGEASFAPQLLALPNGSYRIVYATLPDSALSGSDPNGLSGYDLATSFRAAGSEAWTAPATLLTGGYPISTFLAPCGSDGSLIVLDAPVLAPNASTGENLLVIDPATGAFSANSTLSGESEVTGYECGGGIASVVDPAGTPSFVGLTSQGPPPAASRPIVSQLLPSAAPVAIGYDAPAGWNLSGIAWVEGAPTETVLLYRGAGGAEAVEYVPASGTTMWTEPLPENTSTLAAAAAGGSTYLFASIANALQPIVISGDSETFEPLIPVPGLTHAAIALGNGRIVVAAVGSTGNPSEPTVNLTLAIVPVPVAAGAPSGNGASLVQALANGALSIALAALLVALVLAGFLLHRRGVRPPGPGTREPAVGSPDSPTVGAPPDPKAPVADASGSNPPPRAPPPT